MDFSPDLIALLTFILKGFRVVQQVLNKGRTSMRPYDNNNSGFLIKFPEIP